MKVLFTYILNPQLWWECSSPANIHYWFLQKDKSLGWKLGRSLWEICIDLQCLLNDLRILFKARFNSEKFYDIQETEAIKLLKILQKALS